MSSALEAVTLIQVASGNGAGVIVSSVRRLNRRGAKGESPKR